MSFSVKVWDERAITDAETSDWARAAASTLMKITGNLRRIREAVEGRGVDGFPPVSPANAAGLGGPDHSGPPHGPALRHPVLGYSCAVSSGMDSPASSPVNPFQLTNSNPLEVLGRFWCRPFEVFDGAPYSRGYWGFRARRTAAGTSTVSVTATKDGKRSISEVEITSTTAANFLVHVDGDAALWSDMVPGYFDEWLQMSVDVGTVEILGYSSNQIVKLSH